MKNQLSSTECRILAVLQKGLPVTQTPYKDMAERIGIDVSELLAILRDWKKQGKLRRIGAVLNHFKTGSPAGAMVVWQVKPDRITEVGETFARFDEVSHAYQRRGCEKWPYNIYTMVHGKTAEDVQRTVKHMIKISGVSSYRILVTEKELKKVPPIYIKEQKC